MNQIRTHEDIDDIDDDDEIIIISENFSTERSSGIVNQDSELSHFKLYTNNCQPYQKTKIQVRSNQDRSWAGSRLEDQENYWKKKYERLLQEQQVTFKC